MQSKLLVIVIAAFTLSWSIAVAALLHVTPNQTWNLALPIAIIPFAVWAAASSYVKYRQRRER
jgi:hypothetical protein